MEGINIDKLIPNVVLKGARGLVILTVAKVGLVVTYKVGTILVLARKMDGTWSAPSTIACCGMGWGAQVSYPSNKISFLFFKGLFLYAYFRRLDV